MIEERSLRYPDEIITVCEPIADYLRKFNRATEIVYNCAKATEVPKLSKPELRKRLGLPLDKFVVSYVGEVRYGCKLDLMLEVASLTKEGIHYLVVGGGPLANQFRQQAAAARICNVSIIPQVTRKKAATYVAASDLSWVLYSKASLNARISIPRKLFDSIISGVPVLVDSATQSETFVRKTGCGIVIHDNAPDRLSRLIASLAEDSRRLNDMSSAARLAGEEYAWENESRKLVEAYGRLWCKAQLKDAGEPPIEEYEKENTKEMIDLPNCGL
jgi:glycosyltransferase involved in cell wall biosynthesis